MKNHGLAQGTRVRVNGISITEKFGNLHIATSATSILVERADIDDCVTALHQHRAGGKTAHVGSIVVAKAFGTLMISTAHTPSNAVLIASDDLDDLMVALDRALAHRYLTS